MATQQKAELVYFDGRGYSEIIRLTLTFAGIEFNEVDLTTREEYLALQPDLLFGQVPLLRIDGLKLVQSGAIVRYVARKGKLLGSSDIEAARIEMLYDGTRDVIVKFMPMGAIPEETVKQELSEKVFPKYLRIFNKLLSESSSGYLVGDTPSLADLGLLEILLSVFDYFQADVLQDYPQLRTFYDKFAKDERVVKYVKNIRKRKNDEAYMALTRKILSHLNL